LAEKRTYEAQFLIGAKLLASFKGTMALAQARLRSLQAGARRVGVAFAGMLGKAAMGAALGILGLITAGVTAVASSIGFIFGKIYHDAIANAEQAAEHHRTLLTYLKMDAEFRKKGNEFMENQISLLDQHNAKLSEQTGLNQDIYDQANKTLITYGAMPHHLAEMAGPLGDALAAMKGPRATMQDMQQLTDQVGTAISGGPTTQLRKMGVVGEDVRKTWSKMTKEARFQTILKGLKQFEGAAKAAMDTPIGRIVKFQTAMDKLSTQVGEILLPVVADVADTFRQFLAVPAVKDFLVGSARKFANVMKWIVGYIQSDVIPAFDRLASNPAWSQMMEAAGAFFKYVAGELVTLGDEFAKMWESTLQELEAILIGLAAVSDKFKPALESVSRMREELRVTKMMVKPAIPPPLLAPAPAAPPKFTAVGLLPEQLQKTSEEFSILNETAARSYEATVKPAVDSRAWWQKAADAISQYSAGIDDQGAAMAAAKGDWTEYNRVVEESPGAIQTALSGIGNVITNAFTQPFRDAKTAYDQLKGAIESGISVPPVAAPAVTATPAPVPAVPAMQFGGVFDKPAIAQIAEAGPEAVIPLSRGLRSLGAPSAGATTMHFAPVVTINGNADESAQRAMDTRLRDLAKDFIAQFKAAQYQERRLSYESGYG
jgi:hypothetical protein